MHKVLEGGGHKRKDQVTARKSFGTNDLITYLVLSKFFVNAFINQFEKWSTHNSFNKQSFKAFSTFRKRLNKLF